MPSFSPTLGRGTLYFAQLAADGVTANSLLDLGNTTAFDLTNQTEELDHFSSRGGIKEIDYSVATQTTWSGTFKLDSINLDNINLWTMGSTSTLATTSTPVVAEALKAPKGDRYYQLGVTASNPAGVRKISAVAVKRVSPATTYVAGTDYTVDTVNGMIYVIPGGAIDSLAGAVDLTVDYTPTASSRMRAVSGNQPIRGKLMFKANNPAGTNYDLTAPLVSISSNGNWGFISDQWAEMDFKIKFLKLTASSPSLYIDGVAY